MAMMTVYHGGYQAVEELEIRIGRNTKDFGTGFYCTIIKEQFWVLAKFKYPMHQITFCTEEALKCLERIYDLADIYHSDNIERVSDDFIEKAGIKTGMMKKIIPVFV